MLKAKLIAMNDLDEYEVTLEVKGVTLLCFAVVCPYKIEVGYYYPVEFSLKMDEKLEPKVLNETIHNLEKIGENYEYIVRGKLKGDTLDVGTFSIQDDNLNQFQILDGKYIELAILGLWVTFLPLKNLSTYN